MPRARDEMGILLPTGRTEAEEQGLTTPYWGASELNNSNNPASTPTDPGGETQPPPSEAPTPAPDGGSPAAPPPTPPPALPPGPPTPAIPVPPPPVQFNIGGQGGGEGASSFARPGTAAARPFRSMNFLQSRQAGGSPMEMGRRTGFGSGAAIVGGGAPGLTGPGGAFGDEAGGGGAPGEDEIARLLAQIANRYPRG